MDGRGLGIADSAPVMGKKGEKRRREKGEGEKGESDSEEEGTVASKRPRLGSVPEEKVKGRLSKRLFNVALFS